MPDFANLLNLVEKIIFVLSALVYSIFAIVIVKQVSTMTKNVQDKFNSVLILFSYLHLAFSLFLILLTLVIL